MNQILNKLNDLLNYFHSFTLSIQFIHSFTGPTRTTFSVMHDKAPCQSGAGASSGSTSALAFSFISQLVRCCAKISSVALNTGCLAINVDIPSIHIPSKAVHTFESLSKCSMRDSPSLPASSKKSCHVLKTQLTVHCLTASSWNSQQLLSQYLTYFDSSQRQRHLPVVELCGHKYMMMPRSWSSFTKT